MCMLHIRIYYFDKEGFIMQNAVSEMQIEIVHCIIVCFFFVFFFLSKYCSVLITDQIVMAMFYVISSINSPI